MFTSAHFPLVDTTTAQFNEIAGVFLIDYLAKWRMRSSKSGQIVDSRF
jgi:hypothetical protein